MAEERKAYPPDRGTGYSWPHAPDCVYVKSTGIEWCDCRDLWDGEVQEEPEKKIELTGRMATPDARV